MCIRDRCHAGLVEGGLEGVEAAEGGIDGRAQGAGGRAAAVGPHQGPEERMVVMTAAVVAYGGSLVLRHILQAGHQILDRDAGQGRSLERGVEVVDVGLVVLAVVDQMCIRDRPRSMT